MVPMSNPAGQSACSRCPLDHDRQRALFSNFISDCAGLRIFSSAMRRFLGAMGQSRPSCHQFATAVGAGESRCLCRRRAAVPSMLRDYQQFPTTDGNVEARRRTRPAWREAVPASIDSGAIFPIAATSTMRGAVGRRLCVAPGVPVVMVPIQFRFFF